MLKLFRRRGEQDQAAEDLYAAIAAQARQPVFFVEFGVPDSVLGRFEMVALHAFLVFRRLRDAGQEGRALSQATHDRMFADVDIALRELGIGDMGIGKRVKSLARNLYGRIEAYDAGLDSDDMTLQQALARNVYATVETPRDEQLAALVAYMRREDTRLQAEADAVLLAGTVRFGPVIAADEGQDAP